MRDINDAGDVGEGHIVIALHEHDLLGAGFENVFQAALQRFPRGLVLIDFESRRIASAVIDQLHHDGAIRRGRRSLLILRRRLGHQGFQTLGRQRRDYHENDQQHQQHVDQRRDVHVRVLATFGTDCHTHNRSPLFTIPCYCPPLGVGVVAPDGGAMLPAFFISVKRPSWSTPAARTLSTTSTTQPNFARMSALRKTRLSVRFVSLSLIFCVRSSGLIRSFPKKTLSSRVTATSRASSLSASCMSSGLLTLAISTGTPCCNIGVTTMKMISSTSITSTIGVTLMSELTFAPSFRFANAIEFCLLPARALPSNQNLPAGAPGVPARPDEPSARPSIGNSWCN